MDSKPEGFTAKVRAPSTISLAPQRWAALSSTPTSSSPTTTPPTSERSHDTINNRQQLEHDGAPQRGFISRATTIATPTTTATTTATATILNNSSGIPNSDFGLQLTTPRIFSSPLAGLRTKQETVSLLSQATSVDAILKSDNSEHKLAVLHALAHLSNCLIEEENCTEAERLIREALAIEVQPTPLADQRTINFHRIECQETLAVLLQRQRRFDEAELLYRSSLQMRKDNKCAEDPASFANLGTICITRGCVHLSQGKEILQETHLSKKEAKHARGTAEIVLREAKRMLIEARALLRTAIHLCGDGNTPSPSNSSVHANASPNTSTIISIPGSSPPPLTPSNSSATTTQEGFHTASCLDNTLLLLSAKHNFISIHNYLREIRFLRGKDRGDLNPRRVLSSMQSPLKAIRLVRTVSRYEKELKGSSVNTGNPTPPTSTSKRGAADQDFVDLAGLSLGGVTNTTNETTPPTSERKDSNSSLEGATTIDVGEYWNQMFHRRCTSGFDWYSTLEKNLPPSLSSTSPPSASTSSSFYNDLKTTNRFIPTSSEENITNKSQLFSLSPPPSKAIGIPVGSPTSPTIGGGGLEEFSFVEDKDEDDESDLSVRMMSPVISPRIRFGPGYHYPRQATQAPTSPLSSSTSPNSVPIPSPSASPRSGYPISHYDRSDYFSSLDSSTEHFYPYACSLPASLSSSPGGSGWASLLSPAELSPRSTPEQNETFDDVSLESEPTIESLIGGGVQGKQSSILQAKTKQVVDRVVGTLTLIKAGVKGGEKNTSSTPPSSNRTLLSGGGSSSNLLTAFPSSSSLLLGSKNPSVSASPAPSPAPSFTSNSVLDSDNLTSFDELIFSDDEDDEKFKRQHVINFDDF